MIYFIADALAIEEAIRRIELCYAILAKHVRFVEYSQLLDGDLVTGTYVFCGTVRFNDDQLRLAIEVEGVLDSLGSKVLNRPSKQPIRMKQVAQLMGGLRPADAEDGHEYQIRRTLHPLSREPFACSGADLALSLAIELLAKSPAEELRLWPHSAQIWTGLWIEGGVIPLTNRAGPLTHRHVDLGFDFVFQEYVEAQMDRALVCASDDLGAILPMIVPGSKLAPAITQAIVAIDALVPSASSAS